MARKEALINALSVGHGGSQRYIDALESDWKEWLLGLVPDPVNIGSSNGC